MDYQEYLAGTIPDNMRTIIDTNYFTPAETKLGVIKKFYEEKQYDLIMQSRKTPSLLNDKGWNKTKQTIEDQLKGIDGLLKRIKSESARFQRTSPQFRLSLEKLKLI